MSKTYKARTRFLIHRDFQFQVIKVVLAQTLITSLLLAVVFYLFQESQINFLNEMTLQEDRQAQMQEWTGTMFKGIFWVVVLACVFQCALAFVLSHRVAGPMFRLKRYLEEISGGEAPTAIQFRPKDQFRDVQDAYNEMVAVLEKERQNDLRIIQQMEDGINNLKRMARDEALSQLVDYLERLNQDLKNFKTH